MYTNTLCDLKIPDSSTEQYKDSFFVRTMADSVTAFSSAVGRVLQGAAPNTGNQSRNVFYPVFKYLK